MPKLMMRFLPISFLLFLFISCKSYEINGVQKRQLQVNSVANDYFSNPETDYVYKAHIEVYGNELSGIFVIKKVTESSHRVVLTTDFGNKLFDFELSENDFKVNYIVADLDKKIVRNTLKEDIQLLLKEVFLVDEVMENDTSVIFKSKDGNRFNYLFQSKNSQSITELRNTSKTKEKVVFKFVPKNVTFAESILIQHHNIKLKIELNQISN